MTELANVDPLKTDLSNVEADIELARQFPVSVLVTAPPARALAIAQAIVGEGDNLIVTEVQTLSRAEQAALLQLLDTGGEARHRRIVATASASMFECVQRGTFMAKLFYRLNVIHIVSDSCGDWADAGPRSL
jgi:hypothetical protein